MDSRNENRSSTRRILSVGQLTAQIKEALQRGFGAIWVSGEISNVSRAQSGHVYLTLKDARAQIRAIVWKSQAERLEFDLRDGQEVICRGELDLYAPRGTYQLVIRSIELAGLGELQYRLRVLQRRLAAEGLFESRHKQALPRFPQRIAVVTSPSGAAIRDFMEVLRRRWRGVQVLVVPVRVQGDGAALEIAAAIETVNRLPEAADVLVVTRGGGSLEDLWCFNEESVVRAIFASRVPVISAIGHEIDVTLADLVADRRALTPSEAAELVVPSAEEVTAGLQAMQQRMLVSLQNRVRQARSRLTALAECRVLRRPRERVEELARRTDELERRATRALQRIVERSHQQLSAASGQLETLSPLGVLSRGYSLTSTSKGGRLVRSADQVAPGDQIRTQLADGELLSRVEENSPPPSDSPDP